MENRSQCVHCGGELFYDGDDQWWECSDCGCAWRANGQLMRRGADCAAQDEAGGPGLSMTRIPALEDIED